MSQEPPISFVNDLAELERLGRVIDEFARRHGVPSHVAVDLQLAANEIFTNIVQHGFADDRRHEIVVRLAADAGEVAVEIEDDGRSFDPSSVPAPRLDQPLAERPIGGLGVHLARRVTDVMEYRRSAERNIVRLRKRLAQGMEIAEVRREGVVVLRLSGRLDASNVGTLATRLRSAIEAGERRFVLDAAQLAYVDSAGLQALLVAAKALQPLAGRIVLATLQQPVRRIVDIAGLSSIFTIFSTESDAVAALR